MPDSVSSRVVVIGAGIVGACCALELVRDGHRVTIVEPGEPGGRHAASYGHGCWISPASVVPMSMPGLWKRLPAYLFDAHGPLVIRWRHIGTLLPWLVRFLLAGSTVGRVEATARALATLLRDGPARHLALAAELGMPGMVRREGLLYAYPDRKAFEAEGLSWRLRGMTGLDWKELDRDQLRAREPGLAESYGFGILVEAGAHCLDPGAYVARIVETAVRRGARHIRARATDFVFRGERLLAVEAEGSRIGCDRAVVAAGAWSGKLARLAGDRIPLESERGYHVVMQAPQGGPLHPLMPSDGRMANTPTAHGLRLAGQVELACLDAPPNWERADILLDHARRTYPSMPAVSAADRWMGHRPSTPDGRPVIGRSSRSPDIVHAFGHGHIGFASGPITGRMVADLVADRPQASDLCAFDPRRFARRRRSLNSSGV